MTDSNNLSQLQTEVTLPNACSERCESVSSAPNPKISRGLLYIMLVGLALRLLASLLPPAYIDEAYNYVLCQSGPTVIVERLVRDYHTPFIQILAYPVVKWVQDIFWLRLPAVLIGIGGIWLSFRLARRFVSDRQALLVAALTACGYHTWFNDALFRPYGPLATCCLALWLGMLDLRNCGEPFVYLRCCSLKLRWALFAFTAFVVASLHVIGALVNFTCVLLAYALSKKVRWRAWLCIVAGTIPCIVWVVVTRLISTPECVEQMPSYLGLVHILCGTPLYLLDVDVRLLDSVLRCWGWASLDPVLVTWVKTCLGILAFAFAVRGWRHLATEKRWSVALLGCSFAVPLVCLNIAGFCGLMGGVQDRYVAPMTVPFVILFLVGVGEQMCALRFSRILLLAALLPGLIFPYCPALWCQYFGGALEFIEETRQPGDVIIIFNYGIHFPLALSYDRTQCSLDVPLEYKPSLAGAKATIVPLTPQYLASLISSPQCRHFYLLLNQTAQGGEAITGALRSDFGMANEYNFYSHYGWGTMKIYELVRYDAVSGRQ